MKKRVFVLTIILLLSLLATSTALADRCPQLPKWKNVFNPAEQIGEDAFTDSGIEFKGKLYFIFRDYGTGEGEFVWNQVWGTKDGRNWSFAWDANSILPGYEQIYHLSVFKDQLYAVLGDFEGVLPGVVVRTPDGLSWESVAEAPHHGDEQEGEDSQFSDRFTSFQGSLYAPITFYHWGEDYWYVDTHLWRTSSGDPGTWEEVVIFPNWEGFASFASFKGALYVSSMWAYNEDWSAAQIWRSYDGVNWEEIITDGFGDPANVIGWSFGQKGSYLYIGTGNFDGGEIWRTKDGMNWQQVTTDGLGNPNNVAFGFVTYQNLLYAYSVNNYKEEGCIVYASKDGLNYTPVNEPGWGDPANNGVWQDDARVIFKGALYMGSYGPGGVYKLTKP